MLSAFISSPLIFLAIKRANFDLPDAVGPAIKIIFFKKFKFLVSFNLF
tara:strand:+ start:92 stop:235 length:144 start_codon:yes stop_codon:yes gene_type:complete